MTLQVTIVGAGLGGLTLANGLARAGVDVHVHERESTPDSRAQGARFHMDERGTRALRECLSPEQFALYAATVGEPSQDVCILDEVDAALTIVNRLPFTGAEANPEVRPGQPVSRGLLRRILLAGVTDRVRFGSTLTRYEQLDGGVRAHFADGTATETDVLVGADGIGSAVRRQYLPHLAVADTGVRWLGGKTPLAEILDAGLPELIKGSFTITSTGQMGMFLAVMRFAEPPAQAAARLMPDLSADDTENYLMWALIPSPEQLAETNAELGSRTGDAWWHIARSLARTAHPTLQQIIDRAWPDQTYCLTIGTAAPAEEWQASRVTLLGDAIHAMPPNSGSGANTALQDARILTTALTAAHNGHHDLLPVIAEYERQMRTYGFEAVRASTNSLDVFRRPPGAHD